MIFDYVIRASYGNDSVAVIQWAHEHGLEKVAVLYNDTGWAHPDWEARVCRLESWVRSLGFHPHRTSSIGLEALVRRRKGWPRQGMQFCTYELKIKPTLDWLAQHDPCGLSISIVGVRREESRARANFPRFQWEDPNNGGRTLWAPLNEATEAERDELLARAGVEPLPHRSRECDPCINSNREDLRRVPTDRVDRIEFIETDLGLTSKGKPRTMFRPARKMGATGIREIIRWANSEPGKFSLDDGNGSPGCEAGWCGI